MERNGQEPGGKKLITVLHVIGSLDRGGAESVALDLCRAIRPDVAKQVFICLSGRVGSLSVRFVEAGAEVVPLPMSPLLTFPMRLASFFKALSPDAVVSHVSLVSGPVLFFAKAARVPVRVARLHSAGDGRSDGYSERTRRALLRRILVSSATHIAGVSEPALQFGIEGVPRGRLKAVTSIIANGVDTERFKMGDSTASGRVRAVYVGRAAPEKNRGILPDIARAMGPRGSITIVGPGDNSDLGAVPENVVVAGERDDVETVVRNHDVLVLTSVREGLPGVVLEALASGLPVVASDIPAIRSLKSQLPGIFIVSLQAPARVWADAVLSAGRMKPADRLRLRENVLSSDFSIASTSNTWLRIWTGTN